MTGATIDMDAAKARLASITDDPAVLAEFEEMQRTDVPTEAFLAFAHDNRVCLNWLFLGEGEPFLPDAA